ncbi:hypothetical protein Ahy_A09g045534 [Arachis hypogaea]|uniref:Protein FAR1-RELATED SEQUENCE n=1 Tax=Arachis hypogaea TaxID=3818 RepID=A0A445BMK3_ARAHY|nr:hypothetical protein Ahy_A09g045534 [Arachis hypogaea]
MAIDFDLNTVPMAKCAEEFEQQTDSPDEIVASQSISENMKNYTSSDEIINQAIGDEELDPEEGMCFGTLEDARAYYYRYAARTGFVVKIRTTGWETRNDQRVVVNQLNMYVKDLIHQNDQVGIRPSKTYQALANAAGGLANLTFMEKDVRNYIDMFANRHMWVPVFFKDEFWTGMRSTQRSESMHSVFDKYLNNKEQKELECNAADLRGIIPCVSSSPIEKQFQR